MTDGLRIAHLRIAPQWAILRWAILRVIKLKDISKSFQHSCDKMLGLMVNVRIAHWGAILRWGILSPSVIRIAHPNY